MSPVPDLPDADAIAAAVASCPSVSGLSGGFAGEVATYLPGRRVTGVRTQADAVEVHVVARYGATLHEVESEIRGAVTAAVGEAVRIDVVLADVEDPYAPDDEEQSEPPALEAGPVAALPSGSSAPGSGAAESGVAGTPNGTGQSAAPAAAMPAADPLAGGVSPVGSALPTPPAP